eukprot:Platyproteum_vivax@DN3151_c0_g1_i1.p1
MGKCCSKDKQIKSQTKAESSVIKKTKVEEGKNGYGSKCSPQSKSIASGDDPLPESPDQQEVLGGADDENKAAYQELIDKAEEVRKKVEEGMESMVVDFDKLCGAVSQVEWPGEGVLFVGESQPNSNEGQTTPIRHGRGQLAWQDGAKYKGHFSMDHMTGWGVYEFSDNRVYQGEWFNSQMEGVGVFSWPDGREYIGEYKQDKKHGFGKFRWPDGRAYLGYWAAGKQHGQGIFLTGVGAGRCGVWESGERVAWDGKGFQLQEV